MCRKHFYIYAACLWAAVLASPEPSHSDDCPPIDPIIVDDEHGEPAFTTTGDDWTTWGTLGMGFGPEDTSFHYLSHTVGGDDRRGTATWSPDIPLAGTYHVETWFRMTGNRTHDADHFIHDGLGGVSHVVIDQYGDGPSGWIDLGNHYCNEGFGGCSVVLDGTDDDHSDEANAMRFTVVDCEEPPPPVECDEFPGLGEHAMEYWAETISSSGWENDATAAGAPDGSEASSPNVDAGEFISGGGWEPCDPPGEETIDKVEVEVLVRVQYDSGSYALVLALDGGGDARSTFSRTALGWETLDITGDRDSWDWSVVKYVTARVTLHDHPGGARDSDAWVDAFRLRISFTTTSAPASEEDDYPDVSEDAAVDAAVDPVDDFAVTDLPPDMVDMTEGIDAPDAPDAGTDPADEGISDTSAGGGCSCSVVGAGA